ncbi:MAG: hypothetical protein Satyrvirus6_3 [Satyrvirus sp.]|uniref:Uncharacterized protein n=1 Tax=Satyrvirus sp. TaxID=2487771 RepID=A0A3G5AFW9_9VIRU|nr:MAG: hypothetical protein Satyrvirus6_3 [Satyrvirus sp.]
MDCPFCFWNGKRFRNESDHIRLHVCFFCQNQLLNSVKLPKKMNSFVDSLTICEGFCFRCGQNCKIGFDIAICKMEIFPRISKLAIPKIVEIVDIVELVGGPDTGCQKIGITVSRLNFKTQHKTRSKNPIQKKSMKRSATKKTNIVEIFEKMSIS